MALSLSDEENNIVLLPRSSLRTSGENHGEQEDKYSCCKRSKLVTKVPKIPSDFTLPIPEHERVQDNCRGQVGS